MQTPSESTSEQVTSRSWNDPARPSSRRVQERGSSLPSYGSHERKGKVVNQSSDHDLLIAINARLLLVESRIEKVETLLDQVRINSQVRKGWFLGAGAVLGTLGTWFVNHFLEK